MEQMPDEFIETCIIVLMRYHNEAKDYKMLDDKKEYCRRGLGIKTLLNKIEHDFNTKEMLRVYVRTCQRLNETLNPLDIEIIHKLMENGFKINNVKSVLHYKKQPTKN